MYRNTPMYVACKNGHLSVCEWLYKVGAVAHITKANRDGHDPMYIACMNGHLSVCKWLLEVGVGITKSSYIFTPMYTAYRHGRLSVCKWIILNVAVERRDIPEVPDERCRRELSAWSKQIIRSHYIFRFVFLPGTLWTKQRKCSPHLWMLNSDGTPFKELIAEFVGVEYGAHLRNVHKFVEVLANS